MEPKVCLQCSLENHNDVQDLYDIEVCPHCGYIQNSSLDLTESKTNRRNLAAVIGATVFIFAFIAHSANWGQFIFSAVPLQLKASIGLASADDYSSLAKMCDTLKKYECVEEMLTERVDAQPEDLQAWSDLGVLQFQRRNFSGAAQSLQYYVEAGGKDIYSHYIYAKALSEMGEVDQASSHYERILASKPNTLQITVAKTYVEMLIKKGREKDAKRVIASVRRKGSNASDFMRDEMRQYASLK